MKHFRIFLSLSTIIFLSLTSCVFEFVDSISGNDNVKTETRDVPEFNSVSASAGLKVIITFGEPVSVIVEADENLHDVIHTEVKSGTLKIYTDRNIRHAKAKNILVTVPSLDEIEVSSAAFIKCENLLKADQLRISASSAGEVILETKAQDVRLDASSSGGIEIRGEAEELEIDVSSAGSIDSDRLKTGYCRVSASSAGSAAVWVTEELIADASSGARIRYQGEPESKKTNSSSGGSITER